jgi:hypothetical protein
MEALLMTMWGLVGLVSGTLIATAWKKEFWKAMSRIYWKISREKRKLEDDRSRWQKLCEDSAWFKDREQYLSKVDKMQYQATKINERQQAVADAEDQFAITKKIEEKELGEMYTVVNAEIDKLEKLQRNVGDFSQFKGILNG